MNRSLVEWGHAILPTQRASLTALFAGAPHTYILEGVLEGLMGEAYALGDVVPAVGHISFADVLYVGGDAGCPQATDLMLRLPFFKALFLAPDSPWPQLAQEIWKDHLIEIERYTFPRTTFDIERLSNLAMRIPEGFCITPIDETLAQRIMDSQGDPILEDHIRQFGSAQSFMQLGFGFCVLRHDQIVALVSTYAVSHGGVEIQITTHPDYRRKGLATALGATFVLHCLERGLDPHWDAANAPSCRLAEKLGYSGYMPYRVWLLVDDE